VLVDFASPRRSRLEATAASIPEALEGTLAYISPEQTGRTARAGFPHDLYSLGVLLFERSAGRTAPSTRIPLSLVLLPPWPRRRPRSRTWSWMLTPASSHGSCPAVWSTTPSSATRPPGPRPGGPRAGARCVERAAARSSRLPSGKRTSPPNSRSRKPWSAARRRAGAHPRLSSAPPPGLAVLLLGGPSGVGKTALVRSGLPRDRQAGRGALALGKHDQLGRSVPYAASSRPSRLLNNVHRPAPSRCSKRGVNASTGALGANGGTGIANLVPSSSG